MVPGNGIWQLLYHSDLVTHAVLLTLLVLSVVCWSIFFYKLTIWHIKSRQLKNALFQMKHAQSLEDVLHITSKFSKTMPGYFLSKGLKYLKSLLTTDEGPKENLSDREWGMLEHMISQLIDSVLHREETFVPLLGATVAAAPLLGLFGTVWGLVTAFMDISTKQAADITVVAPGIAQALSTTVAGLLVAIPALAMFYYLNLQMRKMEQQLNVLADKLLWLAQRLFPQT